MFADRGRITGNREVIGSQVGLVPINALVLTDRVCIVLRPDVRIYVYPMTATDLRQWLQSVSIRGWEWTETNSCLPANCGARRLSDIYSPISSPATFLFRCESARSNHRDELKFISTHQETHVVSAYRKLWNHRQHANVALVGMNGSIDWYCYPRFDSPSVFGAILDDKKGGRFQISADPDDVWHKQFYWPSTNVLVTRFLLTDGIVELEDLMPAGLPLRLA